MYFCFNLWITYFHWKILALAGIWTWDLTGTKPICYQLSYPGLDRVTPFMNGVVLSKILNIKMQCYITGLPLIRGGVRVRRRVRRRGTRAGGESSTIIIAKCICAKNYGCFEVNHNHDKIIDRKGINCFQKIGWLSEYCMYVSTVLVPLSCKS